MCFMVELNAEEKVALSDIRTEKSREAMSDAADTFKAGMFKTSVNRSYYAVLHSARALLILHGIDPASHEGVKTMLALHFVKTKILPREVTDIFKALASMRTDVDYGDFESVSRADAGQTLRQATRFVKMVEMVRRRLVRQLRSIRN